MFGHLKINEMKEKKRKKYGDRIYTTHRVAIKVTIQLFTIKKAKH